MMNKNNNIEKNICFMALGKVQASTEATEFKKYIGIASCHIVAFNPTKEELSNIYGREITTDMAYTGTIQDNEGKDVQAAFPTFILKTDPEYNNGIEEFYMARFTVQNLIFASRDKTKCQVIDAYGRTAWTTKEELEAKATTLTKNDGTKYEANISNNYRPAYRGEEALTQFLAKFLVIPSVTKYVNDKWVMVDNPVDSECRLDTISEFFKGNMKEIKEWISLQPNNKIKVAIGIRTTDEGKQYASVYTNFVMLNASNSTAKLDADIQSRKNAGALATTEFSMEPLHEYKVEETNFSENKDMPFEAPTTSPWG